MTDETNGEGQAPADDTTLDQTSDQGGEDQAPAEDAGAATDEAPAPQPKPKQSAAERIAEITREKHDAKREADYWREQAMRTQPQAPPQQQPAADAKPDPSTYDYGTADERYVEDLAAYKAGQIIDQRLAKEREQTRFQAGLQTFGQRLAQQYPDGEPTGVTALRAHQTLPTAVMEVILASEAGPKLADHLGSHPAELHRLSGLSPAMQGVELAKLEARLTAAPPAPKTVTSAPEPPLQVRGQGGQFKPSPDTTDFAAFERLADASG